MRNGIMAVMVVVTIIVNTNYLFAGGILEAAITSLEQERRIASEETAKVRLRYIHAAFQSYYYEHNNIYPKTLHELKKEKPPYIDIDENDARQGYKYKIVDSSKSTYLIVAYPDPSLPAKFTGRYYFCVMEDGLVRQAPEGTIIDTYEVAKTLKVVEEKK